MPWQKRSLACNHKTFSHCITCFRSAQEMPEEHYMKLSSAENALCLNSWRWLVPRTTVTQISSGWTCSLNVVAYVGGKCVITRGIVLSRPTADLLLSVTTTDGLCTCSYNPWPIFHLTCRGKTMLALTSGASGSLVVSVDWVYAITI
jgi:hypothetical protein